MMITNMPYAIPYDEFAGKASEIGFDYSDFLDDDIVSKCKNILLNVNGRLYYQKAEFIEDKSGNGKKVLADSNYAVIGINMETGDKSDKIDMDNLIQEYQTESIMFLVSMVQPQIPGDFTEQHNPKSGDCFLSIKSVGDNQSDFSAAVLAYSLSVRFGTMFVVTGLTKEDDVMQYVLKIDKEEAKRTKILSVIEKHKNEIEEKSGTSINITKRCRKVTQYLNDEW